MVAARLLMLFLPDTLYLQSYLHRRVISHTQQILNDESYIELDSLRGWRNKPDVRHNNVINDHYGSRSFKGIREGERKKWRVILLGDSKINGFRELKNDQTINAFLDCDSIETLNFGTVLYCLDQSFLTMGVTIDEFEPDVVVIGLGSGEGVLLDVHYIPLIWREELVVPLIKPRFVLEGGEIG